jgi:predicted DNA-binding transcriptional regulator AlpA
LLGHQNAQMLVVLSCLAVRESVTVIAAGLDYNTAEFSAAMSEAPATEFWDSLQFFSEISANGVFLRETPFRYVAPSHDSTQLPSPEVLQRNIAWAREGIDEFVEEHHQEMSSRYRGHSW